MITVCIAGATGWTGSAVTKGVLASRDMKLVGAIARSAEGTDLGDVLGIGTTGVIVRRSLDQLATKPDVIVDYTDPTSVKSRTFDALSRGIRVVIGTSGLSAADYADIEREATKHALGVIAAGNFSITAALAKHFALLAAKHVRSWEIIEYAKASKVDAPSGTARELAESLGRVAPSELAIAIEDTLGVRETRGATIGGTQVHSVRLPGYVVAFETIFGLPDERLTIRHDAGKGAEPYVGGTLLAIERVMKTTGLVRGLDTLLFG